jgi:hypothetical protein
MARSARSSRGCGPPHPCTGHADAGSCAGSGACSPPELSCANDISRLVDTLGVDEYAVFGWSGTRIGVVEQLEHKGNATRSPDSRPHDPRMQQEDQLWRATWSLTTRSSRPEFLSVCSSRRLWGNGHSIARCSSRPVRAHMHRVEIAASKREAVTLRDVVDSAFSGANHEHVDDCSRRVGDAADDTPPCDPRHAPRMPGRGALCHESSPHRTTRARATNASGETSREQSVSTSCCARVEAQAGNES